MEIVCIYVDAREGDVRKSRQCDAMHDDRDSEILALCTCSRVRYF